MFSLLYPACVISFTQTVPIITLSLWLRNLCPKLNSFPASTQASPSSIPVSANGANHLCNSSSLSVLLTFSFSFPPNQITHKVLLILPPWCFSFHSLLCIPIATALVKSWSHRLVSHLQSRSFQLSLSRQNYLFYCYIPLVKTCGNQWRPP